MNEIKIAEKVRKIIELTNFWFNALQRDYDEITSKLQETLKSKSILDYSLFALKRLLKGAEEEKNGIIESTPYVRDYQTLSALLQTFMTFVANCRVYQEIFMLHYLLASLIQMQINLAKILKRSKLPSVKDELDELKKKIAEYEEAFKFFNELRTRMEEEKKKREEEVGKSYV